MANKTLPQMPKKKKTTTKKTAPLSNADVKAFIKQGKSEKQTPSSNVGRPGHKKTLTQKTMRFIEEDYEAIERLSSKWHFEAGQKVGTASIIRAIISSALPILENVDAPESEEQLEAVLQALFQD